MRIRYWFVNSTLLLLPKRPGTAGVGGKQTCRCWVSCQRWGSGTAIANGTPVSNGGIWYRHTATTATKSHFFQHPLITGCDAPNIANPDPTKPWPMHTPTSLHTHSNPNVPRPTAELHTKEIVKKRSDAVATDAPCQLTGDVKQGYTMFARLVGRRVLGRCH